MYVQTFLRLQPSVLPCLVFLLYFNVDVTLRQHHVFSFLWT